MRKNRMGLELIDITDKYSEFPEVWNKTMDRIADLIERQNQAIAEMERKIEDYRRRLDGTDWN